jgi:hypothetical protein
MGRQLPAAQFAGTGVLPVARFVATSSSLRGYQQLASWLPAARSSIGEGLPYRATIPHLKLGSHGANLEQAPHYGSNDVCGIPIAPTVPRA